MADFTKAGSDRGDLEKQIKHLLISANLTYHSYITCIEDFTQDELEADLEEYRDQLTISIIPMVKLAENSGMPHLVDKAYEVRYKYEKLIEAIENRLKEIKD